MAVEGRVVKISRTMFCKKSQLVVKGLFVMIISAIVVVSFIIAGRSYGKQEIYFKAAAAKDIAFLLDEMYSTPGDVEFVYPQELAGFGIKIANNKVTVFKFSPLDTVAASYEYAGIAEESKKINVELNSLCKLKFEKQRDIISVQNFCEAK